MTAAVAAVLIVAVLAPVAYATLSTTYGEIAEPMDSSSEANSVFFFDGAGDTIALARLRATDDASGSKDWYIDVDATGDVTAADVRVNTPDVATSFNEGTKVEGGDTDLGRDFDTTGALCYIETFTTTTSKNFRGADRFNAEHPDSDFIPEAEPLYVLKTACAAVAGGSDMIRITETPSSSPDLGGYQAGTRVVAGNDDVGNATVLVTTNHASAIFRYVDLDKSGGISSDDPLYLSLNDPAAVNRPRAGDVRLFSGSDYSFGSFSFGSRVQVDDYDAETALSTIAAAEVASDDATPDCSSGTLQDNIWVDIDGDGTVENGDMLLAEGNTVETDVGEPARTGDDALATVVTDLDAFLAYHDANGDDAFNYGDTIYLDVGGGSEDDVVGAGDIRLSDSTFGTIGTCVTSSSTDDGEPLEETGFPPAIAYLSAWNDDDYRPGDLLYVGTTNVDLGDVRWFSLASQLGSFADQVADDDADRTYSLGAFGVTPSFCFLAAAATYRLEDPLYLSVSSATCANNIKAGDVRISANGVEAGGTNVKVGNSDFNDPLTAMVAGAKLRYLETGTGNSGDWDDEDEVYLDADGAGTTGSVAVSDVRITSGTGGTAGSKVESGDSDVGDTIRDFPTVGGDDFALDRFKFLKAVPSSGTFSAAYVYTDVVVYDTNDNDLLDHGDVFFTGSGGTTSIFGGGTSGGTTTTTTTASNAPSATFSVREDAAARLVTVDATGSTAVGSRTISSYSWSWGDGTSSTGRQATHSYAADGSYRITLTVTDSAGATDSASRTVQFGEVTTTTTTETTTTGTTTTGTTTTATGNDTGVGTPSLGMVVVVLAIAGAALAAARRRGGAP